MRTLAWSPFGKYLVSGAERELLFWDILSSDIIHTVKEIFPAVIVKGVLSPRLFSLFPLTNLAVLISDEKNKIFGALVNRMVYTWHSVTYELLQVINDDSCVHAPINDLSALTFSATIDSLFLAGNRISKWTLER